MIGLRQKIQYLNLKIFVREKYIIVFYHIFFSLDKVRNYFGENVAFYFAFVEFYTKALVPTTIIGKKNENQS